MLCEFGRLTANLCPEAVPLFIGQTVEIDTFQMQTVNHLNTQSYYIISCKTICTIEIFRKDASSGGGLLLLICFQRVGPILKNHGDMCVHNFKFNVNVALEDIT